MPREWKCPKCGGGGHLRFPDGMSGICCPDCRGTGRDTTTAAKTLTECDDSYLEEVARHDPNMIRDVAAALIYERGAT
jgi:DnaJ-class molecular chaperone